MNRAKKVLMVDSLVGNEYTNWLCQAIYNNRFGVELVTTEDRKMGEEYTFPVLFKSPSKEGGQNRLVKLLKYFRYLAELTWLPRQQNADVVHFQFFRRSKFESLMFPVLRALGIKLIHTAHNVVPHESSRIDYFLRNQVYQSAHVVIVHSQRTKEKLISAFELNPSKIEVIPMGTYDNLLPKKTLPRQEACHKLGIDPCQKVLLFFGYIREYKGVDLLLEAFKEVSASIDDVTLVIAGKPHTLEMAQKYEAMIEAHPARDRILYAPRFIENGEVATFFGAADAVALPYKAIDQSAVIHVAHSFGRPVIATRVGDFNEFVTEGKSGYIAEPNDADSLAGKIEEAFRDREKLAEMAEFVAELNSRKQSWDDVGRLTIDVYQKAVE
ncbi:MAG: glycosyltransferase family 4 protein [Chloroflexota bacterium]